jgi:hypothetical protein
VAYTLRYVRRPRPENLSCHIRGLAKKRGAKVICCILQNRHARDAYMQQLHRWRLNQEELDSPATLMFPLYKGSPRGLAGDGPALHVLKSDVSLSRCSFAWVFWNGKGTGVPKLIVKLLRLNKQVLIWPVPVSRSSVQSA